MNAQSITNTSDEPCGLFLLGVFYDYARADTAARSESPDDFHRPGLSGCDKVVENRVRHVFVERSVIAVLLKIELQRFQFKAELVGNIADGERAKVGLAGLRA